MVQEESAVQALVYRKEEQTKLLQEIWACLTTMLLDPNLPSVIFLPGGAAMPRCPTDHGPGEWRGIESVGT